MEEKTWRRIDIIYFGFCIIVILLFLSVIIFKGISEKNEIKNLNKGYKQGQIDCLNGIQNYDKTVRKDTIYFKIK